MSRFSQPTPPDRRMKKLSDLSLLGKIVVLVAVMAVATVGGTIYSTANMRYIDSTYGDLLDGYGRANLAIARANRNLVYVERSLFRMLAERGDHRDAAKQEALDGVSYYQRQIKSATKALPDRAATFANFGNRIEEVMGGACADVLKLGVSDKNSDLDAAVTQMSVACDGEINALMNDLSALTNNLLKESDAASDATLATTNRAIYQTYALVLSGLAAVLGLAFYIARYQIARPMRAIVATLEKLSRGAADVEIPGVARADEVGMIARAAARFQEQAADVLSLRQREAAASAAEREALAGAERARAAKELAHAVAGLGEGLQNLALGDLSIQLREGFADEYLRLRDDFNAAVSQLNSAIRSVVDSAHSIETGVARISDSAHELAQRTGEQASAIEQAASSLDEITSTVRQSAEGAAHASQIVASADIDARKGAQVMAQAIEAMHAIADSTGQIGKIIGVVEDITFQTNLLALNAGVEAARTGEAGKGFAVIAAEVRGLAQRSAEASKEIKRLIAESNASVERGAQLVTVTNEALGRITGRVAEVNAVVARIADGAREQANRLSEINAAVRRIDEVTQKNSAMVEESTAESQTLSTQTQAMTELVSRFRTVAAARPSRRAA
jgi:methyl-accepting chemotaxis protein